MDALSRVGVWLGVGLVTVANLLDPEVVVIGGALAAAGDLLLDPARAVLRERAIEPAASSVRVERAKFGADAGLLGAALVARDRVAAGGSA